MLPTAAQTFRHEAGSDSAPIGAGPPSGLGWLVVVLLTAAMTAVSTSQSLRRYDALRSGWSWDLAYYNQWFWALTQGDGRLTVRPRHRCQSRNRTSAPPTTSSE